MRVKRFKDFRLIMWRGYLAAAKALDEGFVFVTEERYIVTVPWDIDLAEIDDDLGPLIPLPVCCLVTTVLGICSWQVVVLLLLSGVWYAGN